MIRYHVTIQPGTYTCRAFFEMSELGVTTEARHHVDYERTRKGFYVNVKREIVLVAATEDVAEQFTSGWTCKGIVTTEEVADPAPTKPGESPATDRQIDYLRILGYTGTATISKRDASRLIEARKRLTASDVDDFSGPQYTW